MRGRSENLCKTVNIDAIEQGNIRSLNKKEILKIKRSLTNLPHENSRTIFSDAINKLPSRPTRCKILHNLAKLKKGSIQPFLTPVHKNTVKNGQKIHETRLE